MKSLFYTFLLLCIPAQVALAQDGRDVSRINVSVAMFDPGIPADRSTHRDEQVFPRVRKIEALYLPFVLRETLVRTDTWGAVRVVPDTDIAAELLLTGTIVSSDGETLQLHIHVVDASGRVWVDQIFAGALQQDLYDDVAASLRTARSALDHKALRDVIEISLLRYAQQLAPAAFDEYLESQSDGTFTIKRLPASNDPMVARIERIRGVEYIFTDAVDAKFRELSADIASVYEVWREYRRKFVKYQADDAERVLRSGNEAPRGSFEAISSHYENYKWDRQAAQEQEKLAVAFENEMGPTIAAIESRVRELEGWVEDRYDEWRRILAELFELETELPE
ncbi:MAG: hypothetical protein ACR2QT_07360 [Woeseiaceae bacterium]